MRSNLKAGILMIRECTSLPKSVSVASAPYCDDWREIKGASSTTLDRDLRSAGWSLSFMAGELRTFVPGNGGQGSVRRGIERLAARAKASNFNCLQVTEIVRKWSFGVPFVVFTANAFHIEEGFEIDLPLVAKKNLMGRVMSMVW